METLWQDVKYGVRMLAKSPGFTAVAVLTLALGIGANTAIFSVVNAVLMRGMPFPEPERLVTLWQSYPQRGLNPWWLSQANFAAYRDHNRSFERLAAYSRAGVNLTGDGEPERLQIANITWDFFEVLRVPPALGRGFRPEEDAPGRNTVCILSYGLWQRRFGGDPQVLGKKILIDQVPMEVVGVMPQGFAFPSAEIQLWRPVGLDPTRKFGFFLRGIARLKPGVQPAAAEAETTAILRAGAQADANFGGSNAPAPPDADLKTVVTPLRDAVTQTIRKPLLVVLGAVGLVLLIACANVANLLLARATSRGREISVRFALGATPARVARQLLTESLLLSALGGIGGVFLAWWGVGLLGQLPVEGVPRLSEASVDGKVLLFTASVVLLTGLLFGLAPVARLRALGVQAGLREGMRGGTARSSRRMNGALVAAQFALSLILLVAAGLLLKSFERLLAVNPGFQPENVLSLYVQIPDQKYREPARSAQFFTVLLERVQGLPGVRSAGLTSTVPFVGDIDSDGTIVQGHEPPPGVPVPVTRIFRVSPGFFRALGVTLIRGRDFLPTDREDSPPVAVVDETLARRYWPDGDALGKRIRYSWDTSDRAWMTIVGVAGTIQDYRLDLPTEPHMYLSYAQEPQRRMSLVVRTSSEPGALTAVVRAQLHEIDPDVPLFSVRTMEEHISQTLQPRRLTNLLLASFAATALLLAAVGIYGVMSLEVSSRVQEFGIRMALGAQPRDVFRLVWSHAMWLTAAGALLGLVGALFATRVLASLLFEVRTTDAATYASVAALLAAVAFVACYVPARRATRVDPIVALRYE